MLSESDATFIDNVSTRMITSFRNDTFPKDFIDGNPHIFLNFEWINVPKLKIYIEKASEGQSFRTRVVLPVKTEHDVSTIIKNEPDLDEQRHNGLYGMPHVTGTRTSRDKTGHEVIEIISDSEDSDSGRPSSVMIPKTENVSIDMSSGENLKKDDTTEIPKKGGPGKRSPLPFDPSMFTEESDTIWTDSKVTSYAVDGMFLVTKEVRVDRVEYLSNIPCVWPIPKIQTAFILDLRDDAKYLVRKKAGGNSAIPVTPDFLLKNMDQDSWKGGTGVGDSTAQVTFQDGFPSITCRRSRLVCKGVYACLGIDHALLDVERHDLDPAPRQRIFEAQNSTRVDERSSVEQHAATFLNICRSQCPAENSNGKPCTGHPKMKEKSKTHTGRRGQSYFIACSGWTKIFNTGHQTHTIPDNVDEDILAKLMNGQPLDVGSDTNLCSLIISSHIGLKQALCPHPHIKGGRSDDRLPIVNYPCPARRTIYIPIDTSLRVALIVHKSIPHNHPMPKIDKASFETKSAYIKCVEAVGVLGATVQKVDQASSTSVLLGGKTPGQYNNSLLNGRIKQDIISGVKKKKSPAGNGETGVYHLYLEERNKPVEERYIQSFINTPDGGTLIFTCVPALLKLIHEVTSFECDVTFKRVQTLNEWEMELTLRLTGKHLRFKRLSPDGNLLCMNADMEAAQILGAGHSFMKTNNLAYSGIVVKSPEELLAFFVRVCLTHSKRGILDFKFLVTAPDYQRILDFPYMKSQAELDEFTLFITSLGIKKIQDWWNHKIKSAWIIPCILRSKSKILSEHWSTTPATTNVGESQHHWTNKLTGIGLPLLEGIQTARKVDEQVAEEVESSLRTGVMKNKQTNLFHQQNRANQRLLSTARKTRKESVLKDSLSSIQGRINNEKAARQQSLHRQQGFTASLKTLRESGTGNSHMSIERFEEGSLLQKNIDYEKDLRRRSTITQTSLIAELSELSASASGIPGKPGPGAGVVKKLSKVISKDIEATSSGRVVSTAFVRALPALADHDSDPPAPGLSQSSPSSSKQLTSLASCINLAVPREAQGNFSKEDKLLSCFDDAERFEEEDDPEAMFGEADFNSPSDHQKPESDYSEGSVTSVKLSMNGIPQESQRSEHDSEFVDPTTAYEIPNGDTVTTAQGLGIVGLGGDTEYNQHWQPSAFKFGNHDVASIYAQGTDAIDTNHNSEVQNTTSTSGGSFMDFLMDDEVNFNFSFDSSGFIGGDNPSNTGGQWQPYRSTTASSSGEDLSTYHDYGGLGSETYSSSEGELDSSIYHDGPAHSSWNTSDINVSQAESCSGYYTDNVDLDNYFKLNPDMILPLPRIPTSSPSPIGSSSPAPYESQVVDSEPHNLKRPRAPVAADLDTANILPSEHRRKRMKPARVTQME